jgi:hypothetical protein
MSIVKCLVCDCDLEFTGQDLVRGGGFMLVSFHYASKFDQCHGYSGRKGMWKNAGELGQLLRCDEIEAYICDGCFAKKFKEMKGFDKEEKCIRTQKFGEENEQLSIINQ